MKPIPSKMSHMEHRVRFASLMSANHTERAEKGIFSPGPKDLCCLFDPEHCLVHNDFPVIGHFSFSLITTWRGTGVLEGTHLTFSELGT